MRPDLNEVEKRISRRGFLRYASVLTLGGIASVGLPISGNACVNNCESEEHELTLNLDDGQQLTYHFIQQAHGSRGRCFFVHGIGDASSSFTQVIESAVSSGYDVIYYDQPGAGENSTVGVAFESACEILKTIVEQHARRGRKNYCISHSMGGLLMLLTFAKYPPNVRHVKLLAIEPSITLPDYQFFGWIQEPPAGVGYDGLLESVGTWGDAYAPTYAINLANTSRSLFIEHAQYVYEHFDEYRQQILDSGIAFTYVYGDNSSGTEYRAEMGTFPQVQAYHFANAAHWVHVDAESEFLEFLGTTFLKNRHPFV
ncbi:conserved hypothetical protein [Desulfonema ishimotonii]|uniref:AB hydrolase-1 domain-containing protein n=1 Tax=Desulfonema ishimotonii TaxID=45657 RepID=A0A401FR51_9BACT|nr:alpha/beta fold hydrolase [Desulfonema ishimotonii]GBC59448.1 conserved hypothetical protein [Desulfonema ishimotonii]